MHPFTKLLLLLAVVVAVVWLVTALRARAARLDDPRSLERGERDDARDGRS
jgi:hypothetical protein